MRAYPKGSAGFQPAAFGILPEAWARAECNPTPSPASTNETHPLSISAFGCRAIPRLPNSAPKDESPLRNAQIGVITTSFALISKRFARKRMVKMTDSGHNAPEHQMRQPALL